MAIKCVCVWLDETSDPSWIVSRDSIDEMGQAETTDTLWATPDEDEAVEHAKEQGSKLGLPVYRNMQGERPVMIQAKPVEE